MVGYHRMDNFWRFAETAGNLATNDSMWSLDLLIDGESGLWHLANVGDVTWAELAERAATRMGIATASLRRTTGAARAEVAARPSYSVLSSERALLMPTLDDALARFANEQQHIDLSRHRRFAR